MSDTANPEELKCPRCGCRVRKVNGKIKWFAPIGDDKKKKKSAVEPETPKKKKGLFDW